MYMFQENEVFSKKIQIILSLKH